MALFRSLFRGRDDVYARRFVSSKTGNSGYAPACANEWVVDLCNKKTVKCAKCPNRRFRPLTDEVIRWHLSGQDDTGRPFVMGLYPMLLDERCFLLAADFDKKDWETDAEAFLATCRSHSLPAVLERSRSGGGGHVWLFFDEAIPAALARKLGSFLLTETMETRPDIGLDSYDRLFPNQDTLPQGGFGNLIALPLQKQARERGNSVFLDENFIPLPDQWAFLSGVGKIRSVEVEGIVREAEGKGRIVGVRVAQVEDEDEQPWTTPPSGRRRDPPVQGPLPDHLDLVLGNMIYIPQGGAVTKPAKPPRPAGRLSESGVLQESSDAAAHVRNPSHPLLRRRSSSSYRASPWVPGRGVRPSFGSENPPEPPRRAILRQVVVRFLSRGTPSRPEGCCPGHAGS